jgi:uncharacterized protein YciI
MLKCVEVEKINLTILCCLAVLILIRCDKPAETSTEQKVTLDTIVFDSALAQKVGADDYGMKQYVMAFLKSGPNHDLDSLEAVKLQSAHMDNIQRMADEGKLIIAGPLMDSGDLRGIYIFDVRTLEEAAALTASDPAIKAGSLVMELHKWYSSAALPLLYDMHKKVAKKNF